jgi:Phytanoyl-CoA dioxygenase (PhyH)
MDRIMEQAAPLQAFAQNFHEAGFGVIRQAIEPDAADRLRTRLVPMLPNGSPSGTTALQRVLPRIVERDRMFADLATNPPLVATMTTIFGGTVPRLVCSYGHEKPARTGAHTGPHSDVAHLPGVRHHLSLLMVKAMIALTPVTLGSGATMLIPGSHRQANGTEPPVPPAHHRVLLDPGDLLVFVPCQHPPQRHRQRVGRSPPEPVDGVRAAVDAGLSRLRIRPGLPCEPATALDYGASPRRDLWPERSLRHHAGLTLDYAMQH